MQKITINYATTLCAKWESTSYGLSPGTQLKHTQAAVFLGNYRPYVVHCILVLMLRRTKLNTRFALDTIRSM